MLDDIKTQFASLDGVESCISGDFWPQERSKHKSGYSTDDERDSSEDGSTEDDSSEEKGLGTELYPKDLGPGEMRKHDSGYSAYVERDSSEGGSSEGDSSEEKMEYGMPGTELYPKDPGSGESSGSGHSADDERDSSEGGSSEEKVDNVRPSRPAKARSTKRASLLTVNPDSANAQAVTQYSLHSSPDLTRELQPRETVAFEDEFPREDTVIQMSEEEPEEESERSTERQIMGKSGQPSLFWQLCTAMVGVWWLRALLRIFPIRRGRIEIVYGSAHEPSFGKRPKRRISRDVKEERAESNPCSIDCTVSTTLDMTLVAAAVRFIWDCFRNWIGRMSR